MVAYGSSDNPVRLDPFQTITEVHWPANGADFIYIWGDSTPTPGSGAIYGKIEIDVAGVGTFSIGDFTGSPAAVTFNGETILEGFAGAFAGGVDYCLNLGALRDAGAAVTTITIKYFMYWREDLPTSDFITRAQVFDLESYSTASGNGWWFDYVFSETPSDELQKTHPAGSFTLAAGGTDSALTLMWQVRYDESDGSVTAL